MIEALRLLTRRQIAEYPDYDAAVRAAAARLGVTVDSLLLTNGLDEGILMAALLAFRATGGDAEGLVVVPAFDMYAACTDATGGNVVEVPLGERFEFPIERILNALLDTQCFQLRRWIRTEEGWDDEDRPFVRISDEGTGSQELAVALK